MVKDITGVWISGKNSELKVSHFGWRNAMESKSTLEPYKEKLAPRYDQFYDCTYLGK